jgi:AcrR family transcriptional regulator
MARPRSDIEPRILRAARARFLVHGVDGTSLRDIARDAKTSIGMVSYYFPTKDDLFLAVVEQTYVGFLAGLEVALAGDAQVKERLRRVSARLGRATDDELDVVRLVAREALSSSSRFERILARFQRGHVGMVARTLAAGMASGEIDDALPIGFVLACTLGCVAVPQLFRRAMQGRGPYAAMPEADGVAALAVGALFGGIGKRRTRRKAI